MTPDARSIASVPTSERSETSADWRSASICACAIAVTRAASAVACVLRLGDDLLAVLAGGLADAAGLGARVGELRGVLLERRLGLALRLVGLRDVALDRLGALVEQLLHAREHVLPEEDEDDDEADRRPDDVVPGRKERVGCRLFALGSSCSGLREASVAS